jgi:hypothetical protein
VAGVLTPAEVARAALARIEQEGWIDRGDMGRYYESIAAVMREYLESIDPKVHAAQTSTELLGVLATRRSNGTWHGTARLFGDADLVKFAGVSPDAKTGAGLCRRCAEGHRCLGPAGRVRLMRFASPWFLLLLLVPLLRIWLRWRGERRRDGALAWVSAGVLEGIPRTPRARLTGLPRWLEFVGGTLLVLALARPQLDAGKEQIRLRSRNIIVALDISSSMKPRISSPATGSWWPAPPCATSWPGGKVTWLASCSFRARHSCRPRSRQT